jgi:hypothetical protein
LRIQLASDRIDVVGDEEVVPGAADVVRRVVVPRLMPAVW